MASTQRNLAEELTLTTNGFVFDHVSGLTYTLNATGSTILRKLMNGKSAGEIIKSMTDEFEISDSIARKDLEEFIEQARTMGIV